MTKKGFCRAMANVFIAYDREDSDFAELVQARLTKAGHRALMDYDSLHAGDDWRDKLDQAIREADALVVIMTPEASASEYVTYEWAFALGAGVKVIPVELETTVFHPRLEVLQRLDFTDKAKRAWDALMAEVQAAADLRPVTTVPVSADAAPVVKHAVAALDSLDPAERIAAVKTLAQTEDPAAQEALAAALRHPVQNVRIAAAFNFPDRKDPRILDGLLEAYPVWNEWTPPHSWRFVERAAHIGPPAVPRLLEVLKDQANPSLRTDAAEALGRIGELVAVPALIEALTARDEGVRRTAAWSLGEIADKAALPALQAALKDGAKRVRESAAGALGKLRDHRAVSDLIEHLHDDTTEVCAASALALGRIGSPTALPELLHALQDENEAHRVRTAAAQGLGLLGDKRAVEGLRQIVAPGKSSMEGQEADLCYAAAEALARLGDIDSIPLIVEAVNNFRGGTIPSRVVEALGALGEIAIPALASLLDNRSSGKYAVEALKRIGTPPALTALKRWDGTR
jgi:HEAT repeat protein